MSTSSAPNSASDGVKRPNKIKKYTPPDENSPDDPTADYMNLLGMVFSMFGLMMKMKWCAWMAVFCSFISFANSRCNEDGKQMFSSFIKYFGVQLVASSNCVIAGSVTQSGEVTTNQLEAKVRLSISAVVMSYLQNPAPMTLPWQ